MGFEAASFGIEALDGRLANPDAIRVAAARGINLSGHQTTSRTEFCGRSGDLLACMEWSQAKTLEMGQPSDIEGVFLLGSVVARPRIADPYGKPDQFFEEAFDILDAALNELYGRLRSAAQADIDEKGRSLSAK